MRIEPLGPGNFADYERLTACGDDGSACYCSFWYSPWASMDAFDQAKRECPESLRESVRQQMQRGFHVGALAYDGDALVAWISVAPVKEVYWCWKRVAQLGPERAGTTAGITCLTIAPEFRGRGRQQEIARALLAYGRERGWKAIEAYPFDAASVALKPEKLAWPGFEQPYVAAGFVKAEPHWLSRPPELERWVYRAEL